MPQPTPGAPTDRPRGAPPRTALSTCCVVLCRTQGPVNLGMVARLCGNLGVTDLRFVAPLCEIDCPEARMFSTHNREMLLTAPVYATLEDATADCELVIGTSGDFRMSEMGRHVRPEEVPAVLNEHPAPCWALVFGNEADGLNAEELAACQAYVHLDTYGTNISFNLANAVAITLYVIATASAQAPPPEPALIADPMAQRKDIESLYRYWYATLDRFGYFRRTDGERFAELFRRFVDRLRISRHDLQILRGSLAQMNIHAFGERFDGKSTRQPTGQEMAQRDAKRQVEGEGHAQGEGDAAPNVGLR